MTYGLLWISRQFDQASAVVLFGDRVSPAALRVKQGPLPLDSGAGYREVQRIASEARIAIIA